MIAMIDYGVGNLFSLKSSFAAIGVEVRVTDDEAEIRSASRIILPGVGAFGDAAAKLRASGLDAPLLDEAAHGKPVMGICLGMQMLFDKSYGYGEHRGLGLLHGEVRPISEVIPAGLKVPQMGWNALKFRKSCPLFKYIKEGDCVYFVHSFAAMGCEPVVAAVTEYGADLTAVVQKANVMGCQFHPEKSGTVGLSILRAFCELETGSC